MRRLLIASDLHINPIMDDEHRSKIDKLIKYASQSKRTIILAGDIFDYLEFGWDRILADPYCADKYQWVINQIYLNGNHDKKDADGNSNLVYEEGNLRISH